MGTKLGRKYRNLSEEDRSQVANILDELQFLEWSGKSDRTRSEPMASGVPYNETSLRKALKKLRRKSRRASSKHSTQYGSKRKI
jgi:hypothetical protein